MSAPSDLPGQYPLGGCCLFAASLEVKAEQEIPVEPAHAPAGGPEEQQRDPNWLRAI